MKKKILTMVLSLIIFSAIFIFISPVKAQGATPPSAECTTIFKFIQNISKRAESGVITEPGELFNSTQCIIYGVINLLLGLGVFISAFFIMLAGVKYMTAAGNATKQADATKSFTSAVVGFALLLVAWTTYNFVIDFIEYDAYKLQFQNIAPLDIEKPQT